MGIPSYFRIILQRYKDSHSSTNKSNTDYFLIDFNSILYGVYGNLDKDKCLGKSQIVIANMIIKNTLKELEHIICEVVKPTKMVYIAFDGPAPRAKMVQQRSRRFKSVQRNAFINYLDKKYDKKPSVNFNTAGNFSPGTQFMDKLCSAMTKAIKAGKLSKHIKSKGSLEFVLNTSNVPGEGEHKYMPLIRKLDKDNKKDSIVVYSPDADVIVLSISSNKDNIKVMTQPKNAVAKEIYPYAEFIFLDINLVRKYFLEALQIEGDFDVRRICHDYVFLTTLEGNDFVVPVQYLSVRRDEMKTVMRIYKKNLKEMKDYLIDVDEKSKRVKINEKFLLKIFEELAKDEKRRFQNLIKRTVHRGRKNRSNYTLKAEKDKSMYEIELSRYEHEPYYRPENPDYKIYNREFNKIDYWKEDYEDSYYKYFLKINVRNESEYDRYLKMVCQNYLESLVFTIEYYLFAKPAWRWHYRFRCAPLFSTLVMYLRGYKKALDIKLEEGSPFTPLQQLFMILPPQLSSLLPKGYGKLMTDIDSPLIQYFPIDFKLDVMLGQKQEYSEPLLPELDEELMLEEIGKIKLTKTEERRNLILKDPIKIKV